MTQKILDFFDIYNWVAIFAGLYVGILTISIGYTINSRSRYVGTDGKMYRPSDPIGYCFWKFIGGATGTILTGLVMLIAQISFQYVQVTLAACIAIVLVFSSNGFGIDLMPLHEKLDS